MQRQETVVQAAVAFVEKNMCPVEAQMEEMGGKEGMSFFTPMNIPAV